MTPKLDKRLVPAAGYLRRSTDKQEASIPEQKKAIEEYARANGYTIIRWYIDDSISGDATGKREAFLRMIADASALRDFKAILCWDRKRFGRFDSIEYGYYVFPLRKAGVMLATVLDGITDWNDPSMRIVAGVMQEGAHKDLRDHGANVARGLLGAAQNGGWVGKPPYAYRLEGPKKNKRLVIEDPAKVVIVRRIFRELTQEDRAMKNIADRLNAEGVVSPGGRVNGWRFDTVKTILETPAYTGDFAAFRWSYGKYCRVKGGRVEKGTGRGRNPEAEWIVRPDHHVAIIDRETFARAQEILAEGKGRPPHTPETNPYALSRLLRCGRCGAVLRGDTHKGRRYYECGNFQYNGAEACPGTTVREDRILHTIADHLDKEYLSLDPSHGTDRDGLSWRAERKELTAADMPKAFAKLKAIMSPPAAPEGERRRNEKRTKELAAQVEKARGNLVLLDPENIPAAQDKIRQLEQEKAKLEAELRKRPPSEKDINATVTEVLRSLWWLAIMFRSAANQVARSEAQARREEGVVTGLVIDNPAQALRPYLRSIASITAHTEITGAGSRVRHVFKKGEITFRSVGGGTGDSNPHLSG